MRFFEYLKLLRVVQWYKNLVIFLPLIFIGQFLQLPSFLLIVFGFIALCLVSSANYIFNDLLDAKADRKHPEKRHRPLAARTVSVAEAVLLFLSFLSLALFLASWLSATFLMVVMSLFVLTLLYSLWLKHEAFIDILAIAVNFVLRAVAGTFLLNVSISPWLILCPFFLSLFLSAGKRKAELGLLKEAAVGHRKVLKYYTPELTTTLLVITTTLLLMSYSLYSFLSQHAQLIWTMPVALYVVFRYVFLIYHKPHIARHPERVIHDFPLTLGILLWTLVVLVIIYL